MKRILPILSVIALALVSCRNKDLCYLDHPHWELQDVLVFVHWPQQVKGPATGMRTNLFQLNNLSRSWVDDLEYTGGTIRVPNKSNYIALCYDYFGPENIYIRKEDKPASVEAYCGSVIRSTYSKTFPTEKTVFEADSLYTDKVGLFRNPKDTIPHELHFYVKNVTKTYTFEIRGVRGTKFITATRGALSGISASYFLYSGSLANSPSTVLFNAAPDAATERIVGTISTFGRVADAAGRFDNKFTIEILYPSAHYGIIQMSWDVTPQLDVGNHIIIDADIDIIPDANGGGSAFDVDVKEWDEVIIPVPI